MTTLQRIWAENPGVIISTCALLFTVGSFWWIQLKPGKLVVTQPRSFELGRARANSTDAQLIVLPLVFFNKGAIPVIVQNLRLIRVAEGQSSRPFTFQHFVNGLGGDVENIATQFPVLGREALLRHLQFLRVPADIEWVAGSHRFKLDAVLVGRRGWRTLLTFDLSLRQSDVDNANTKGSLLVDNTPDL